MGIFSQPNLYTAKQMKYKKAKDNAAMKDIMAKEGVSKILDKPEEREEFFRAIKKEAGKGGLTKESLKKVLGDFRQGRGRTIDKKETTELAEAIISKSGFGGRLYTFRKEAKSKPISTAFTDRVSQIRMEAARRRHSAAISTSQVSPASSANRIKNMINVNDQLSNKRFSGIVSGVKTN